MQLAETYRSTVALTRSSALCRRSSGLFQRVSPASRRGCNRPLSKNLSDEIRDGRHLRAIGYTGLASHTCRSDDSAAARVTRPPPTFARIKLLKNIAAIA